jgi:hypothetical protein
MAEQWNFQIANSHRERADASGNAGAYAFDLSLR